MDLATLGALCALGSAVAWAAHTTLRQPRNAARTALGALLIAAWMAARDGFDGLAAISTRSLVLLLVSIITAIAIGDTVFFESTRTLGLGRAMTLSMSYPVIAAVLAALPLDERITARFAIGGLLTLNGLALVVARRRAEGEAPRSWVGIGAAAAAAVAWGVSVPLGVVFLGKRLPPIALVGACVAVVGVVVLKL